ncbi:MAG: hypothetical protein RI935_123 [Candidatus Parcubacteria bacterium]
MNKKVSTSIVLLSLFLGAFGIYTNKKEEVTTFINTHFIPFSSQASLATEKLLEVTPLQQKDTIASTTIQEATTEAVTEIKKEATPISLEKKDTIKESHFMHGYVSDTDESYTPTIHPCKSTMSYSIGSLDARFGLKPSDFKEYIEDAISVWEDASSKNLFSHKETGGDLTINLIYDARQERSVDIGYLILEVENSKDAANALKKEYSTLQEDYTAREKLFQDKALAFKAKLASYEADVKKYNDQGGAQESDYKIMMNRLELLNKESAILEEERKALLENVTLINTKINRYNEFVAYINVKIKSIQSISRKTFTEGRFTPYTNTIDIFLYTDKEKLERVLIHELGHALGIGHVEDTDSIMYYYNSGKGLSLSEHDKEELRAVCQ